MSERNERISQLSALESQNVSRRGGVASGDLLLGARFAFVGGRDGWARTVLTALGVGIGVALLLLGASVPGALAARQARGDARGHPAAAQLPAGPNTLLVGDFDTVFRDQPVRGRILRPEGPHAPTPPGVAALPRAGEVVVSPALKDLLDSPDGRLFAPRLGGAKVVGTISAQGLAGPRELAFYLGSDTLPTEGVSRIDAFGSHSPGEEFGPILILLVVIIFVVLLLPIAVFLGAAVRFGGERRDRRLAALRLVGADSRMIRRIAAGEAAAGTLLGLAVGGALFVAGRQVVPLVELADISVFASDVRPALPLVVAIVLAVPTVAVAVSLIAMRRVVVEPLGVTRRAGSSRRRLWWRLLLPGAGLALLYPLTGGPRTDGEQYQVAAGAVLLLAGAVTLLPWLIDLAVRRMRGGPVAWQLATRRLQFDSATSARLVNGIAVAVAGTIGLQMLFASVQNEVTQPTGQDPSRAQAHVQVRSDDGSAALARLLATPGVTGAATLLTVAEPTTSNDSPEPAIAELRIGECAALAEFARLDRCADGDVFVTQGPPGSRSDQFGPGTRLQVGGGPDGGPTWSLPGHTRTVPTRTDPLGWEHTSLLVTPAAINTATLGPLTASLFAVIDPADPDALERLRNTAAAVDPRASVNTLSATIELRTFVNVRRGLYLGAVVTLLLIGASLLVGVLEQLRERRRLLAMLVAVGTRRATLSWSVLWQTTVPVLIGLALAVLFGLGLGAVLLRMVSAPIAVSWPVVGLSTGLAALVVLLMTGLSLPMLWRLTRVDGLRTE